MSAGGAVAGFSLVELLMATVILAIGVAGTAQLFMMTNLQSESTRSRYELQARIERDLAIVRRLNDRFTCNTLDSSGTPTTTCTGLGSVDPQNWGYLPKFGITMTPTDVQIVNNFESRCRYQPSSAGAPQDLVSPLVAEINALPDPDGVDRVATATPAIQAGVHRYRIVYSRVSNGEVLRQVELVPTAAGWCP